MGLPEEYIFDNRDIPSGKDWTMRRILRDLESGLTIPGFKNFFDRDPRRVPPDDSEAIVSPADGILDVRNTGGCVEFTIHLRLTDVHVQRVPCSGTVQFVKRIGSGFFSPSDPRYPDGVQVVTTIDSALGSYEIRQMTTFLTKRIQTFVKPGQSVRIGARLGRIRLGSTVKLLLPDSVRDLAKAGQKVCGGETILARHAALSRQKERI